MCGPQGSPLYTQTVEAEADAEAEGEGKDSGYQLVGFEFQIQNEASRMGDGRVREVFGLLKYCMDMPP